MSQDWIKLEKITLEKKEVARIATALKMDRYAVIGRLVRLWVYFDSHTEDGRLEGVDFDFLDDLIGKRGFCLALESQNWIANDNGIIVLPNFDRHNGETAKKRAMSALRQAKARAKTSREPSRESVTPVTKKCDAERNQRRGEEKREEENRKEGGGRPVFDPSPGPIDEATELAQEYAFIGGDGTSPTAITRARAAIVDCFKAGLTREAIEAEINRPERSTSEHPGAFCKRLIGGKKNEPVDQYAGVRGAVAKAQARAAEQADTG